MKSAAEYVIIAISGAKKGKNGGSAPVRHTVSKPANLKPISEYTAIDDGFSEVEMKAVNCPNCGAPVEINKTARCPYCGSNTTENDEFVINTIKGVSQRTGK